MWQQVNEYRIRTRTAQWKKMQVVFKAVREKMPWTFDEKVVKLMESNGAEFINGKMSLKAFLQEYGVGTADSGESMRLGDPDESGIFNGKDDEPSLTA